MNFLRTEWIVNNDEELIGRMHTRGKNVRCACVSVCRYAMTETQR